MIVNTPDYSPAIVHAEKIEIPEGMDVESTPVAPKQKGDTMHIRVRQYAEHLKNEIIKRKISVPQKIGVFTRRIHEEELDRLTAISNLALRDNNGLTPKPFVGEYNSNERQKGEDLWLLQNKSDIYAQRIEIKRGELLTHPITLPHSGNTAEIVYCDEIWIDSAISWTNAVTLMTEEYGLSKEDSVLQYAYVMLSDADVTIAVFRTPTIQSRYCYMYRSYIYFVHIPW